MSVSNEKLSNDKHLWVSWDEYHQSIEKLMVLVHESGWQFDQILCLARGGLRPGDMFARVFDVPLAILATSSYREAVGTVQGKLDIASHITITKGSLSGRVLLIDDLADSGKTLIKVREHLQLNFPAVTEVKSAVIWRKACSAFEPDFYAEYLPTNPWIHQPFEDYDVATPAEMAERLKAGRAA